MTTAFRMIAATALCLTTGFSALAQEQAVTDIEGTTDKIIEKVVEKALSAESSQSTLSEKTDKIDAKVDAKIENKDEGQQLFFSVDQNPEKMSGQLFSASNEDRKALPQAVFNWVLNNLGPTKSCSKWVANFCSEDFNLVSYEPLKESKQFVILQHQFSLKQDRMVYYVLSADGELQQMQLSRDEKVTIKPNSALIN